MLEDLVRVRDWAQERINSGEEPPWAWFQYMKLVETADAILASAAVVMRGDLPLSEVHPERHLRLVADSDRSEIVQRPPAGLPTLLPM